MYLWLLITLLPALCGPLWMLSEALERLEGLAVRAEWPRLLQLGQAKAFAHGQIFSLYAPPAFRDLPLSTAFQKGFGLYYNPHYHLDRKLPPLIEVKALSSPWTLRGALSDTRDQGIHFYPDRFYPLRGCVRLTHPRLPPYEWVLSQFHMD